MNTKIGNNVIELIADDEVFKPVVINGEAYNEYWISNYGRCYNQKTCKFITPRIREKKGTEIYLYKKGKGKSISPNKLKEITFGKINKSPELIADDEIFKQAVFDGKVFDGYLVSNYGRVWSDKSSTILKLQTNNKDFVSCFPVVDGKLRHVFIHYLTAYTFIPNINNSSKVHHSDGNRSNNKVSNLVWRNGNPIRSHENVEFNISKIELIADDEVFKPLKIIKNYYNDFYISNYGRCYSISKNKMLKSKIDRCGSAYYTIHSVKMKKQTDARVHMLVAYSFVDKINKNHKEVRHIDGNKLNNKFDNLQWCEDNTTYIKFDNTVDISKIKLIAPDEIFAIAKTDNKVYNAYLISNYGRLYSKHIKKVVKGNIDGQGYKKYMLGRNNNISAHRLVGFSFVENPNIEDFDRINHKDENRINNYYKNLEWCDNDYNLNYNKNDTWEERTAPRPVLQLDENYNLVKRHSSITQAAKAVNISYTRMREWCNSDRLFRGYNWQYA